MNQVELLIHNIRSVYNVASMFRTAECLGVNKIWLSGYTPTPIDRFGRSRSDFKKVSLGTESNIDWEVVSDVEEFLSKQKESKYKIIGLEQDENSIRLRDVSFSDKVLLIPGTETTGLDDSIKKTCGQLVEIEQVGDKESLNVHAATSIAIWKLMLK